MAERTGSSVELHRLATIDRNKGSEQLRISVDEFTPSDGGKPTKYISLRVWYDSEDGWRPSRKGLTVKRHEILEVARVFAALARKVQQSEQPAQPPPLPKQQVLSRTDAADLPPNWEDYF